MDLRIQGADQLGALAKDLRAAGDTGKGLKKELNRAMTKATKPLRDDAKASALASLPQKGGLAAHVATKSRFSSRTLTGRNPGVSIVANGKSKVAAASTNKGTVRHPVFGNRKVFVGQSVASSTGWFDDTMRAGAPTVRKELIEAMETVADKIRRG